ncbi:MAG TPA: DNA methyltransferase [Rubrobacter sp.]|nr:DNA methyltransferase [Rubrobacter sp.]
MAIPSFVTSRPHSRAQKVTLRVVPTCVGPRLRDAPLGEQGRRISTYLQLPPGQKQRYHCPTPFRLAHPFRDREGDLVFDPFCGSGTSGVASKELGRFFVGAEKERVRRACWAQDGAAVRGGVLRELSDLSARDG